MQALVITNLTSKRNSQKETKNTHSELVFFLFFSTFLFDNSLTKITSNISIQPNLPRPFHSSSLTPHPPSPNTNTNTNTNTQPIMPKTPTFQSPNSLRGDLSRKIKKINS
jgi:hypothetical protein